MNALPGRRRIAALLAGTSIGAIAILGAGVARAADVEISTNQTSTVVLDGFAGSTAQVDAGVSVTNPAFSTLCPTSPPPGAFTGAALCASTSAWALTNLGTIGPATFGDSVHFNAGGSVTNFGSIINKMTIEGGASGSVDNKFGATITLNGAITIGEATGIAGTIINAGTITSTGQAIGLWGGGTVTNLATGYILGQDGANAVSVILGTSRVVDNYGIIQSNDSGFGTGVAIQNGVLTNYLGGQILGAYNGVWANGASATSVTNDGYIEASLAQGFGSAIEVDGGGTVVNTGTIKSFTSNGDTTDAGINFTGAGSVTNSGIIESTTGGKAIIFNGAGTHTLNLDTGSVLGGNVQGGTGTDNLVLMGTGTEAISKFLSLETLSMTGTDWTLTGTGTFSTSTTVTSGFLHVNGQLTSPTVTIDGGGTLGGTGTVVGAVTNNGNIAPGNSIGTLNITGNYTQATGSTYTAEVNTTTSDLINITGTATIQGGTTVSVLAAPGVYTLGQRYTILTAASGVTGTYTTLTDNAPFVDFQLAYDLNNVYLDVILSAVSFQEVAQTPNQMAAAGGVTSLGAGNPVFDAVLLLDAAQARNAFDLLSGEIHASVLTTLLEQSRFIRDSIGGRLRQFTGGTAGLFGPQIATVDLATDSALAYAGGRPKRATDTFDPALTARAAAPGRTYTAWTQTFGSWGHSASDGNAAALNRSSGGFVTGIDQTLTGSWGELWRLELAGGYQRTTLDVNDRSSSGHIDSYDLAAYGGTQRGPIGLRAGADYAWHNVSTSRTIAFPGFSDAADASYHAHTAQVFGEAGYGLTWGRIALEPFAALAYVDVQADNFTESGGAAALTGSSGHADTTFSTLGARAAVPLAWAGMDKLTVKSSLGWRHAFGTITPTTQLAFAAGGTPFVVAGLPIAKNAAAVELGVEGKIGRNAELSVAYAGQLASDAQDHGIKGIYTQKF